MADTPKSQVLLYQAPDGRMRLEVRLENETVWLTQGQMAELFQTSTPNVSMHIRNFFSDGELQQDSVVKEFLTTAADGKLDGFLRLSGQKLLAHAGSVSHEEALRGRKERLAPEPRQRSRHSWKTWASKTVKEAPSFQASPGRPALRAR